MSEADHPSPGWAHIIIDYNVSEGTKKNIRTLSSQTEIGPVFPLDFFALMERILQRLYRPEYSN